MPVRAAKLSSTIVSGFVIDAAFITTIVESPPAAESAVVGLARSAEGRQSVAETTPAAAAAASTTPATPDRVVNDVRWILLNRLRERIATGGVRQRARTPPASIPRIGYAIALLWQSCGYAMARAWRALAARRGVPRRPRSANAGCR